MGLLDVQKEFEYNPQRVVQEIQQVQKNPQPRMIQKPEVQEKPINPEHRSAHINLDKIWQIESSKGTDPNMGRSTAGARGHFQFLENTWNECVKRMGKNWDWYNGSMNYEISKQVADYYFNTRIPQMINYYNIPDTVKTRIASYSWGIGNLKNAWETHGKNWEEVVPGETRDYFIKYGL